MPPSPSPAVPAPPRRAAQVEGLAKAARVPMQCVCSDIARFLDLNGSGQVAERAVRGEGGGFVGVLLQTFGPFRVLFGIYVFDIF